MLGLGFRGSTHESCVHWYRLYLVTGLLAGDPLSFSRHPELVTMMWAISPRGVSPGSPDIKQLKLTRWQARQDYNILLGINFNNGDLPRDSLEIEKFNWVNFFLLIWSICWTYALQRFLASCWKAFESFEMFQLSDGHTDIWTSRAGSLMQNRRHLRFEVKS